MNNIAASMGCHAERATCIHRKVLQTLQIPDAVIQKALPDNQPIDTIARGIYKAWYLSND